MNKDCVVGLLMGFGAGLGLSLLFAPRSGTETRALITDKSLEGADYVVRQATAVRDSTSDLIDKGRQEVARRRKVLEDAIETGKQAYREAVEQPVS